MPGRNEHKGAATEAVAINDNSSFFSGKKELIFGIFCFPIFVFDFAVISRADRPKRPVRRGIRGSLTGRLKVAKPKKPESIKTISAEKILSSLKTKYADINTKIKGIIVLINK
jgi:hypothetical protein